MHDFEWCGITWQLTGDITTGEWYQALREIVAPFHEFVERGDSERIRQATDAACAFCSSVMALKGNQVDRDVLVTAAAQFNKARDRQNQQHVFPHLFNQVINASSWGEHERAIHAYYQLSFGSQEFKPDLGDGPCACDECRKRVEFDEGCLFRQEPITAFARQLSAATPELVLQYWNAPYYLFRHAQIVATHRGLSMAAKTQKPLVDKMRKEQRSSFYAGLRDRLANGE